MQSRVRKSALVIGLLFGLTFLFQNCADQKFSQAVNKSSGGPAEDFFDPDDNGRIPETDNDFPEIVTDTGGPNCRTVLRDITTPVRVLTVVDTSGSNVTREMTDPNRAVRSGSIQRFYNTYKDRTNFAWGFITFARENAYGIIAKGNDSQRPAFGDSSIMNQAIAVFNSIFDGGDTPYYEAMNLARKAIADDTARPADSRYVVVFLSDGRPNPYVPLNELKALTTSLVNTVAGRVSFNTVYYGRYDADAAERLREMAAVGGGNFLDTNANPTGNAFKITDLVQVPSTVCDPAM